MMNKEEAKHFVRKWYLDHGLTIGGLIEAMDGMIDAINPYPEETVLPKVVGDWVGKCTGQGVPEWLLNMSMMPREVSVWLRNKGNYVDEHHQQLLMYAYLYGWVPELQPDKLYRIYVPGTDQVYVYTHRVWSDRKVHLEVQEIEEQSDDLTELFTERQIDELKLQDYEREEAKGYVK